MDASMLEPKRVHLKEVMDAGLLVAGQYPD
jgi:hypothetical protein